MRTLVFIGCVAIAFLPAAQGQEDLSGLRTDDTGGGVLPWYRLLRAEQSLSLLQDERISAELELVDEQTKKFTKLNEQFKAEVESKSVEYRKLRVVSLDTRLKFLKDVYDPIDIRTRRKVIMTLLPFQNRRFSEIVVQMQMPHVLADERFVEELDYTDEQQQALAKLFAPHAQKKRKGGAVNSPPPSRQILIDQCLGLLTEEQKAKYESIVGEAFDVSKFVPRPAPGYGGLPKKENEKKGNRK